MNIDQQVAYLMRGVEYGDSTTQEMMEKELRERLLDSQREGRPLRVYCGYDPRTSDLHIGHTVTMRKLRQFQELGHHVIFVIGTYTALIGDPSDKDKLRAQLSQEEAMQNAKSYADQAFRILDREKTEVRYNAEWLKDLTLKDMIELALTACSKDLSPSASSRSFLDANTLTGTRISDRKFLGISHSKSLILLNVSSVISVIADPF